MIGFVQHLRPEGELAQFQCFTGDKLGRHITETSEEILLDERKQIVYDHLPTARGSRRNHQALSEVKYEDMSDLVSYINDNHFTWNAKMNEKYSGLNLS